MLHHNSLPQIVWNSLFTPAGDRGGVYNFDVNTPVSILPDRLLYVLLHFSYACYTIDLLSW